MIGSGKERRGRYYLDKGPTQILHHAAGAKEKSDQSSESMAQAFWSCQLSKDSAFIVGAASGLIPLSSMSVTRRVT